MKDTKQRNVNQATSRHQPVKLKKPNISNIQGTVRRIWEYMRHYKKLFVIVIILVVISSILSLLGPYLLGKAVDTLLAGVDQQTLLLLLGLLVVVFLLQSVTVWFQNYWMITVAQQAVYHIRKDLFHHVLRLPLLFFQKRQSGELMSRLTNDIENVSRTLNTSVIQLATSLLTLVGTIVFMLLLSPLLTVLTFTIVPLMFWGMKWITSRTNVYFKKQQKDLGELNGYVEETLSGHHIIKLFNQEERVERKFEERNQSLRDSGYWAQVYSGFIPKLMNSLNNLSFTIIVGVGALLAFNGTGVTIGIIVAFTTYARQFTRPLNDLANQFNTILSAVAGAERVFDIIDEAKEDAHDAPNSLQQKLSGDVRFASVYFSYEQGIDTLEDVSFHAKPGEVVALVGPTGAGKTTIISLLSRFYEVEKGTIYIDNKDIREFPRNELREQMGIVLQDSFLFDTTIKENIRYGRLEATDEEVIAAAKSANAHTFITQLDQGYDTMLDSNGSAISQGQRQLISIARAMLANPSILILDEATSSIDTITEIKINEALSKLMEGRTTFVIAHRLNTIKHADKILVLEHGKVIEQGNHAELLQSRGFYANLVTSQNTNQSS
ncbi:ABC transporter ATP-binding protein/permease [Aquibacillus koreensis]|uniref:ABC transporter ATP-binding protein/permease n=1 Tax=Aquibacillus koreensis TaxID=279446 RepID=A0A9X3WL86_9BACI|nr:ABC transporter ATP-binding protein [Aquibacillus koreensis]MCT2538158.1 ABC transporter ATP-binding protein/permease [Aquibacillus koreensis]MDC3420898.1 ABC transporter ATP-binding protein/permease [Aquibacillus koreensis]